MAFYDIGNINNDIILRSNTQNAIISTNKINKSGTIIVDSLLYSEDYYRLSYNLSLSFDAKYITFLASDAVANFVDTTTPSLLSIKIKYFVINDKIVIPNSLFIPVEINQKNNIDVQIILNEFTTSTLTISYNFIYFFHSLIISK